MPAVVTAVSARGVSVETQGGASLDISGAGLRFVARALSDKAKAAIRLRPGALVRVMQDSRKAWSIVQVPKVAAAFVALDANTGAYRATGRRLRLQPAEVQPRDAGLAPAGVRDQAIRVFGGAGKGLFAGHDDP